MQVAGFLIALAAAGLMGFANQRGGTCTVAAIDEIVATRRFGRMIALLEASLWVGGGLVLLNAVDLLPAVPPGYAVGLATIAGGILFGLGAFVNQACLFGTVARLGSGEWAYAATPVGLFLGSLATAHLRFAEEIRESSLVLGAPAWGAMAAVVLVALRVYTHGVEIRRIRRSALTYLWSPRVVTTIIGITFLVVFVTAGNWDYAEFLRDLGQGDTFGWLPKSLLALALLTGAIVGGWMSGSVKFVAPDPVSLARRLVGGALMGAGATLIPGGNTGLILLGMPLLWPYAWLAFLTICITIYVANRLTRPANSALGSECAASASRRKDQVPVRTVAGPD